MALFALAGMMLATVGADPVMAVDRAGLQGTWASECQPVGKAGRHGLIIRITFHGRRIDAQAQMYATNACQTPTFKLNYRGNAEIRRASGGSFALDHTARSLTLTPQAVDVVSQYNQGGDHGCGLQGWQLNVPRSVAGKRCDPFSFPMERTTLYDVVWVDGDELRFGSFPMLWTNISADKRPTRPLPVSYHKVAD